MSRVELAKISSLMFYKDEYTAARRTPAIPRLVCRGKPCKLFQPEAVRCVSIGGAGVDVDWKCEADLPEALRFGKVEVSCEGWSKPGDPYVLKGSCSLDYRLVQVPGSLLNTDSPIFGSNPFKTYDISTIVFSILWVSVLVLILYSMIQSCLRRDPTPRAPRTTTNSAPRPGGGGSGWFPGAHPDDYPPPPPPYSKNPSQGSNGWGNWRPGFWTGAVAGGLANQFWNSATNRQPAAAGAAYDWERDRVAAPTRPGLSSFFGARRAPSSGYDDNRGEGSSNLGATRRSTGLGGSSVR
ncbi:hypothetical protein K443DRAFT_134330 [Laccaria amethystina LaAM-08-1]|uniref:Store-operated calcium entry-associated regulatory factor n=1 Tax=Laccaria amethystina LaAM-08-1 TaxID=1095629 RepID=A0A0C9WK40_9AGAR|nr:hypothetical protein K443DRAFT_134330 [Laccaria amethystina LaAM-08-1]